MPDRTLKSAFFAQVLTLLALTTLPGAFAQVPTPEGPAEATNAIARIRDEGLNHSQVMQTLSHLTEVIGPRLTGSPNLKRANEWTASGPGRLCLSQSHYGRRPPRRQPDSRR